MKTKQNTEWLDKVVVYPEPLPHIKSKELNVIMPDELKEAWNDFIMGQTGLRTDGGDFGIYSWDFDRFASKLKASKKLEDSAQEWD